MLDNIQTFATITGSEVHCLLKCWSYASIADRHYKQLPVFFSGATNLAMSTSCLGQQRY